MSLGSCHRPFSNQGRHQLPLLCASILSFHHKRLPDRSSMRLYWKIFCLPQHSISVRNILVKASVQFYQQFGIPFCFCTHICKYAMKNLSRNNAKHQYILRADQQDSSSAELGSRWTTSWTWASNAHSQQKSCRKGSTKRKSTAFSSGLPNTMKTWTYRRESTARKIKKIKELGKRQTGEIEEFSFMQVLKAWLDRVLCNP